MNEKLDVIVSAFCFENSSRHIICMVERCKCSCHAKIVLDQYSSSKKDRILTASYDLYVSFSELLKLSEEEQVILVNEVFSTYDFDFDDVQIVIIIEELARLVESRYWSFYAFIKNTGLQDEAEVKL